MINIPKTKKKLATYAINPFYSVYVYESVNLDDGDSALVESPFLLYLFSSSCCHPERSRKIKLMR